MNKILTNTKKRGKNQKNNNNNNLTKIYSESLDEAV